MRLETGETAEQPVKMGNSHGAVQSEAERRANIRQMDLQMNRRFGRSSKHALRLVLRGEKETGKTSITKLLSGNLFDPVYKASDPSKPEEVTVPWAAGPGEDVSLTMCAVSEPNTRKDGDDNSTSLKITHSEKNKLTSSKKDKSKDEGAVHYKGADGIVRSQTLSHVHDVCAITSTLTHQCMRMMCPRNQIHHKFSSCLCAPAHTHVHAHTDCGGGSN